MFGEKTQQAPDLTSPENFEKGEAVYDRIVSGECKDARAELHAAYGTKPQRG
ncbi:hypothetical protein [Streptomyces olivochromogenes]|uniref:hypothetical protein n=1 Tax=Streptomyces olivochromogenes TaxID=1963 RepID=UPI001F2925C3|nr:hypothetical protein [Streptomyces olivochromogenes]MCF3129843.1 hypothetical protein [Streptomyces olivochromogenes]